MPPIDFEDLEHEDGDDNTAGIGQYIYVAKAKEILKWPKPKQNDSTGTGKFSDLVTITDNFIMKPGCYWRKVYVTLETGKVDDESQGEMDGMSFLNKLEFFHPGSKAEALGFAQWAKNSSLAFLVPELDGNLRLVGHELYPAKAVTLPGTTGQQSANRKGRTFTFQCARKGPAPIFKGNIEISEIGSVDVDGDGNQDIVSL